MNKRMRELQAQIMSKTAEAKGYMEGESKDLDKAESVLNEIDALQKEYDLEARMAKAAKSEVPTDPVEDKEQASGFKAMSKMLSRTALTEKEKALISGADATHGENYLVPDDVKAEINELRKTYISAKSLVTVETTDALAGSVNYESGMPAGLVSFTDGEAITEETAPAFVKKSFAIQWHGKLIPISRILLGAEKAGLMSYINRFFLRNAIISENGSIFYVLKSGYNGGTPKALSGWKALKKSMNVDLDPSCWHDGVIVTNQSGFAALDEEEDADGRPVLQPNPANPTQKLFQGKTIHVFPDSQLPNIDATHFPVFYGSLKAGATFVEHQALEFAASEHYGFNTNQHYLRVIEGYDVMSTDTGAYIYGSFAATPAASA